MGAECGEDPAGPVRHGKDSGFSPSETGATRGTEQRTDMS